MTEPAAVRGSLRTAREQLGFGSIGEVLAGAPELGRVRAATGLREAILTALDRNRAKLEEARGRRSYLSPAWHFAVALRERPELADLDAASAAGVVGRILAEKFGGDAWRSALGSSDSLGAPVEPQSAFLAAWDRVEASQLRVAIRNADATPVDVPGVPTGDDYRNLRRFASTLAHLAEAASDRRVFVSCRAFAEALGVSRQTVSNWRAILGGAGLLLEVEAAQTRKRATVFEWRGPRPVDSGGDP